MIDLRLWGSSRMCEFEVEILTLLLVEGVDLMEGHPLRLFIP
jgi:hypothetical protein